MCVCALIHHSVPKRRWTWTARERMQESKQSDMMMLVAYVLLKYLYSCYWHSIAGSLYCSLSLALCFHYSFVVMQQHDGLPRALYVHKQCTRAYTTIQQFDSFFSPFFLLRLFSFKIHHRWVAEKEKKTESMYILREVFSTVRYTD